MAINISQIEENVETLLSNLSHESFIYDLLSAYGQPKASITRLKKGDYNLSKDNGMVLWKKKLCFKHEDQGDLHSKIDELSHDPKITKQHPRFIVVTDFKNLLAADTSTKDTLDIPLAKLHEHCDFFLPWAGMEKSKLQSENPADVKAAERMGRLYDLILEDNPIKDENDRHALNIFFTRLLFCFFAEDTGIFPADKFTNGLASHTGEDGTELKEYLEKFFQVLNVKDNSSFPSYFRKFPYVNGGLFANESPAPKFSRKSRKIIIECGALNWKAINPDIFGSMMQAVVHTDQRSGMGMHYTSVVNIMKVVEPLFLNDLYEELEKAGENEKKLKKLLDRIYNIRIFDPACGSGNFLIIAYKELCKLEIQIFKKLYGNQRSFRFESKLRLTQFYGIEIDDFAHETAKLSLWLAEHQMNVAFREVFGEARPTLPLQDGGNVVCENATRIEWNNVCPKSSQHETYILGNPPYAGSKVQSREQKKDMIEVFAGNQNFKFLDYISCWFYLAAKYLESNIRCAFVSTSSLNQGLQVEMLWPKVIAKDTEIYFSYKPFNWSNHARGKAGVSCSIIGLRKIEEGSKTIYDGSHSRLVNNINPYLVNGKNIIVKKVLKPLTGLPPMGNGNPPREGGLLILSPEEKEKLITEWPQVLQFIRPLSGSSEYIRNQSRWCIWIEDQKINEARKIPIINERIEKVREFRLKGGIIARGCANVPHRFYMTNMPKVSQILIPIVSAERREYIPSGFLGADVVVVNSANTIFDPEPYVFGVLNSKMHMIWVKAVAGRMRMDLRYSPALCWNTFPCPVLSKLQKTEIEKKVFALIDERENFSELTMAEMYDPQKMPSSVAMAHSEIDQVVERCYRPTPFKSNEERLEHLFRLYEQMTTEESQQELPNA